MRPLRVIAVLDTMWNWRALTPGEEAPMFFRINPDNHSGRRLYSLIGEDSQLLVVNSCKEVGADSRQHGVPDPMWLHRCLWQIERDGPNSVPADLVLVCGSVAKSTFGLCGYRPVRAQVMHIMHPAARSWTGEMIRQTREDIAAVRAAKIRRRLK